MALQIATRFRELWGKLLASLRRFPEALLLAAAVTVILILMNHDVLPEETWTRVAMVLALGIPVSLCLRMYFERSGNPPLFLQGLFYGLTALGLIGYYHYFLPHLDLVSVTRYIALTLALYCLFTLIPYGGGRPGYEQYIVVLLRQFFITVLYGVVLFIGLVATAFAIDQLLFPLWSEIYLDIWLCVVGLFGPAFFLADVPLYGRDLSAMDYSKILKVLLYYIVMPLILAYTVILYLYFAKILLTRQWPVGMVSHLVLWYAMVTTLVLFVLSPLREENLWVKNFYALMPKLLLPLLAMMFVAMGIRINAYGVTENRYFVLAAGVWVTGSIVYLLWVNKPKNVYLVLFLAVMALLTVFGPWSAYSVSKASQTARFAALLERNEMLQNGKIVKAPATISTEDKESISSIILYFDRYHGLEELAYLPAGFQIDDMKDTFGFALDYYGGKEQYFSYYLEGEILLPIADYDYFYSVSYKRQDAPAVSGPLEISYDPEEHVLQLGLDGSVLYEKDLDEIGLVLHENNKGKREFSQADLSFTEENERILVHYVFKHLSGLEEVAGGNVRLDPLEFYLFIKVK